MTVRLKMPMLPTIDEEEQSSGLRVLWKYRLQFQSMASASVNFIAGGMKLAWSLFEMPTGRFLTNNRTQQLAISWLLGVVLGASLAAFVVQRYSKNVALLSSSVLLFLCSLLFIVFPLNFNAMLWACIGEGFAFGLTQVQALVTGAEVAHKDIRGLLLSGERIFLWLGICLQLLYTHFWYKLEPVTGYCLHVDQVHGIMIACLGILSFVLTLLHRFESPLLLFMQQRDSDGIFTLKRLHGVTYPSPDILRIREDYKQLIMHDAGQRAWTIFQCYNAFPLIKLMATRCFVALSVSVIFNRAFLILSSSGFGCEMNCLYLMSLCGLLGSVIGAFLIDAYGRRKIAVLSLLLAGIFVLIVGGIFHQLRYNDKGMRKEDLGMGACHMLLYQIVICAGVAVASTVYVAEAFTISMKAKCLALICVSEQGLQLMLTVIAFHVEYSYEAFFFTIGCLTLLLGLIMFLFMPETKLIMLSDCLRKFKNVWS